MSSFWHFYQHLTFCRWVAWSDITRHFLASFCFNYLSCTKKWKISLSLSNPPWKMSTRWKIVASYRTTTIQCVFVHGRDAIETCFSISHCACFPENLEFLSPQVWLHAGLFCEVMSFRIADIILGDLFDAPVIHIYSLRWKILVSSGTY